MTSDQVLAEIREANLSYLMLAQSLIRSDREQALFRLGIGEDNAAFGTDMNGVVNPVISSFADLQRVVEHWDRRNIGERRIRKLAIENYARVLKQAFAARQA